MRVYLKKMRIRLKTKGICIVCRKKKVKKGYVFCEVCLVKRRKNKHYNPAPQFIKDCLRKQKRRCAICRKKKKLILDHCHKKNKKRGLLCNNCNVGLGMFKDSVKALKKATTYLSTK